MGIDWEEILGAEGDDLAGTYDGGLRKPREIIYPKGIDKLLRRWNNENFPRALAYNNDVDWEAEETELIFPMALIAHEAHSRQKLKLTENGEYYALLPRWEKGKPEHPDGKGKLRICFRPEDILGTNEYLTTVRVRHQGKTLKCVDFVELEKMCLKIRDDLRKGEWLRFVLPASALKETKPDVYREQGYYFWVPVKDDSAENRALRVWKDRAAEEKDGTKSVLIDIGDPVLQRVLPNIDWEKLEQQLGLPVPKTYPKEEIDDRGCACLIYRYGARNSDNWEDEYVKLANGSTACFDCEGDAWLYIERYRLREQYPDGIAPTNIHWGDDLFEFDDLSFWPDEGL